MRRAGEDTAMRVLVTVASRHGGTREIGYRIAAELEARGLAVDVVDPDDVASIEGFDAVVLGSAVYSGHWLPAARQFAERFESELSGRPVWLLSSGLATAPAAAANSPAETQAMLTATGARGHRAFGGRLDVSTLDVAERAIIAGAQGKEGDHRDMVAVAQWSARIADALTATPAPAPA